MKCITRAALAASISAMLATGSAMAADVELKLSHFLPSVHGLQTEILEPWAKALDEKTATSVEVEIFSAGSSFGNIARQLDQVQAGVIDIAVGLAAVPRDRLPRTELVDMPLMAENRSALNKAVWDITADHLSRDYKGLKLLGFFNDCAVLHARDKELDSLAALEGMRVRVPSVLGAKMLSAVGAIPVTMPSPEVYENMEKGVIDGVITVWDFISTLKFHEVTKSHLDNVAVCGTMWFAMNERKYDSLPEDVRAAIDELSGQTLIDSLDPLYEQWEAAGKAAATDAGHKIYKLSPDEQARWATLVEPIIEERLKEVEAMGVSDIREAYSALTEAIARREGEN
ncbi:MAG: C4-dicarboxylate ABC transporter [Phyllobacteriaceae bacterium]|nr:C4-dicarboxylate ABC transporter [Phyllobacteriaceae bacterium]MBA91919.1 C4-dicarboxylate ABC transporter [Phyllobacteriaceae bacterium]